MLYKLATVLAIIMIVMGITCEGQNLPIPIPSETFSGELTGFVKYASQEKWYLYFIGLNLKRFYAGDGMNGKQVLNASIVEINPNSDILTAWEWTLTDESKKSTWLIYSNDPKTCHKMPYIKLQKVFDIDAKDYTFVSNQIYFNGKFDLDTWTSNPPYFEKNLLNLTSISFDHKTRLPVRFLGFYGNTTIAREFISFNPTKPKEFILPDICKESSYKLNLTSLKRKVGIPTTRTHPFLYI